MLLVRSKSPANGHRSGLQICMTSRNFWDLYPTHSSIGFSCIPSVFLLNIPDCGVPKRIHGGTSFGEKVTSFGETSFGETTFIEERRDIYLVRRHLVRRHSFDSRDCGVPKRIHGGTSFGKVKRHLTQGIAGCQSGSMLESHLVRRHLVRRHLLKTSTVILRKGCWEMRRWRQR